MSSSNLYFRQLLGGRDFGKQNPVVGDMANFIYLIGDHTSKKCLVVDPAWDPEGLKACAAEDGFEVVGAICTHYHGDHLGGTIFGMEVQGLKELCASIDQPMIYAHRVEIPWIERGTKVPAPQITAVEDGDVIQFGHISIRVHYTPGHTAGGICLEVENCLVTADTLFLSGCGRTDLPGGNAAELYESLFNKIAKLNPTLEVYCGHAYSGMSASLGEVLASNPIFQFADQASFVRRMG